MNKIYNFILFIIIPMLIGYSIASTFNLKEDIKICNNKIKSEYNKDYESIYMITNILENNTKQIEELENDNIIIKSNLNKNNKLLTEWIEVIKSKKRIK